MVYLDGDNNLDPYYLNVFNQLKSAAGNPAVNVVAVWDRFDPNIATYYYEIQSNTDMSKIATYTQGVNRWYQGELNMASPTTLSDFIQWARSNYPAQHYALFISDHGTGLKGIAQDFSNGNQYLNIDELGTALSTATSNGNDKIDIVFADACLMAMIEVGYQIRNYANIYIASENIAIAPDKDKSRPYPDYINGITYLTTPQELSATIVNQYAKWLDDPKENGGLGGERGYTISAVDLTQITPLITAISNLTNTIRPQINNIAPQIHLIRSATQKFNSTATDGINDLDEYVDLIDLA